MVGYVAARHMIDLGRTRIAFIGGKDHLQPVHHRRAGVRRAVSEEGGRVSLEEISTEDLNASGGRSAGEALVARAASARPDAVIAVTDLLGMAMIRVFAAAGISVPGDIAVMGCDANSLAWGGAVPLTSVELQGLEMGAAGFGLLLAEMTTSPEDHVHRTVVIEPVLVPRESTVGREPGF